MCGIFGSIGDGAEQLSKEAFITLSNLLAHRGPDDQGYKAGQNWMLGFRRLSILDLSPLGHQPMCSPDGRFWMVFNGEVYNYLELRHNLEQKGERFQGGSDTEVILRLFARQGVEALKLLNGMFSLVVIDTHNQTFFMARDRLGVKPLYYHITQGQVRFASELKVLAAWPDANPIVDPTAVLEYLTQNYLSVETCIFQEYQKLAPGHYLAGSLHHPQQASPQRYWKLELNDDEGTGHLSQNELEDLHQLLLDAVSIRLRSDVPVGIFLSGGLDSGLVAAMAGEVVKGAKPLAITVGFDNSDFDETSLAKLTAQHLGFEHRVIEQSSTLSDIDRIAWFYDEPFGDVSALPTFMMCEAAAKYATVYLSGDGGDEAFGGYERYIKTRRYDWMTWLPGPAQKALKVLSYSAPIYSSLRLRMVKSSFSDKGFAAAFDTMPRDPAIMSLLHPDLKALANEIGRPLWARWKSTSLSHRNLTTRQQALDYDLYLPDDILVKADRASMAHSIELRSPFLDYRLVEWAARIPRAKLLNARQGKLPLRKLSETLLPAQIRTEQKRGFGVPLGAWLSKPDGMAFVRERLLSDEARHLQFWDHSALSRLLAAHQSSGRDFGELIWRLLMLDAWASHYMDGKRFLQGVSNVPVAIN